MRCCDSLLSGPGAKDAMQRKDAMLISGGRIIFTPHLLSIVCVCGQGVTTFLTPPLAARIITCLDLRMKTVRKLVSGQCVFS